MGYEVIYRYKEATETPGVYSDEIKERSTKIGKVTEEVPLEALAAKVMSQLARRNVLIVDVEIWEYEKRNISYRETPNGIVLKNKKFSFDAGRVAETCDWDESPAEDFKPIPTPSKDLADRSCPVKRSQNLARRAIRQETYDPDPVGEHKVRQKGLKFTVGRKYPVYSEESMGSTLIYVTTDDTGREVRANAEYFVAVGAGLSQEDEGPRYVGAENQKDEINLWGNVEHTDMPDIRSR